MDDFFDDSRTDGRVLDQPAVAFDGVAVILLDRGAIAAGFASKSRGSIHLRRVIIQMNALRFVRAIRSKPFCLSSLSSIVIPRTAVILSSSYFSFCESLSSVSRESDSLLRRIESEAFSSTKLRSVCLSACLEVSSPLQRMLPPLSAKFREGEALLLLISHRLV
jgi:hypothetical protein